MKFIIDEIYPEFPKFRVKPVFLKPKSIYLIQDPKKIENLKDSTILNNDGS
jgi:hypothetical protein